MGNVTFARLLTDAKIVSVKSGVRRGMHYVFAEGAHASHNGFGDSFEDAFFDAYSRFARPERN